MQSKSLVKEARNETINPVPDHGIALVLNGAPQKGAIVYSLGETMPSKTEFDGHIAKYGWDFDVDKDKI